MECDDKDDDKLVKELLIGLVAYVSAFASKSFSLLVVDQPTYHSLSSELTSLI